MAHIYHIPSWWPTNRHPISALFISDLIGAIQNRAPGHQHSVGLHVHRLKWFSPHHPVKSVTDYFQDERPVIPLATPGIEIHELSKTIGFNPVTGIHFIHALTRKHMALVKNLKKLPDLFHVHVSFPSLPVGFELSKRFSVPFILTEHSSKFPDRRFESYGYDKELFCRQLKAASALIPVSAHLALEFKKCGISHVKVIPNFIPWRLLPLREPVKPFSFLLIALMNDRGKRIDLLLKAAERLLRKTADFTIQIVGDGSLKKEYMKMSEEMGLNAFVQWHGLVDDQATKQELISGSGCLMVCSERETFGITVIEAHACGIPVLSTRCGAVEELITADNGLVVDKNDPDKLAEGMEWMMRHHREFDRIKIQADCFARYASEKIADAYLEVYDQVIHINN